MAPFGSEITCRPDILSLVQDRLRDSFWQVRHAACLALRSFGANAKASVESLADMLLEGTIKRTIVAESLVHIGHSGKKILIEMLSNELRYQSTSRVAAAYGLGYCPVTSE
eukprot:21161_1